MPYFCYNNYSTSTILLYDFDFNKICNACAIYLFAFSNHPYIFNVLETIKRSNETKTRIIVFYAFYIQFFVYLAILFISYFSTFQNTREIFIDRPNETVFMNIGKAFFSFGLICHIGMLYFSIKNIYENLLNRGNVFSKTM